jgi:hypothetical protein
MDWIKEDELKTESFERLDRHILHHPRNPSMAGWEI